MSGFNLPPGVGVHDIPGNEKPESRFLYEYQHDSRTFCLTHDGVFYIRKDGVTGNPVDWYKDTTTQKPWVPAKRKTFVSLVKSGIRDGDYDNP